MKGPLWIKVCGVRTRQDVEAVVAAGADAVGFVFHAPSPRHLEPEAAGRLAAVVPPTLAKVAVFLHPAQALVDAAIEAIRPDWVQGDATDLETLDLPAGRHVLPVYRTGAATAARVAARPAEQRRFLLESARSGAGEVADWTVAASLAGAGELVLAGGLDAGNVGAAIAAVRPFGVDVSSGVERARGVKDADLIREFVRLARKAADGRDDEPVVVE